MSSPHLLRLRIVTNTPGVIPFYLAVEYDMTVVELRGLVAVELAFGEHSQQGAPLHSSLQHADLNELTTRVKMTLRGSTLSIDDETILQRLDRIYGKSTNPHRHHETLRPNEEGGAAVPASGAICDKPILTNNGVNDGLQLEEKLFIAVMMPSIVRPTAVAPPVVDEASRVAKQRQVEQQLTMMEPMIQMMASNPSMLASLSPELGRLLQQHPEAAREFSNPDTLRDMFRAGVDPEARRDMDRTMQTQLAQIQNIPGGMGMLENMMGSVQRDMQNAGEDRPRTAADMSVASEERSMPTQGTSSNTRPVPNPWRRSQQPPSSQGGFNSNPFGSPFQGGNSRSFNSFGIFGGQQQGGGLGGIIPNQQQQPNNGPPFVLPTSSATAEQQPPQNVGLTTMPPRNSEEEVNMRVTYSSELAMVMDMSFEGVSEERALQLLVKHDGSVDEVVIELAKEKEE